MKKAILLLASGLVSILSNAQENKSILFTKPATPIVGARQLSAQEMNKLLRHDAGNGASESRTTSGPGVDTWYNLWDQNYTDPTSGGISVGYYFDVYPDSSLLDNSGSTAFYTNVHGMGMSFDPTDSSYSYTNVNGGSCQMPIVPAMTIDQLYIVDSFAAPIVYMRNNASTTVVDSLIIELVVTPILASTFSDSGAYDIKFIIPSTRFAPITYDSTPRFSTIHYNGGSGTNGGAWPWNFGAPYDLAPYINDCYFDSVLCKKQRFAFALTNTTRGDTLPNGTLDITMLAAGISSGSGALGISPFTINSSYQHLVSFVSFKSGAVYPLGTNVSAANWLKLYAGQPIGATTWFMQSASNAVISYPGSYQDGVWATNEIRYNDSAFAFPHISPGREHDVLIPSYAYAGAPALPGFDVPQQSFHVFVPAREATTITNKVINTVSAYPNPATSQLNVTYSVANNATVIVTLTNMVGQVVATQTGVNGKAIFNTSTLADGMYIYSVQAGGERITGHVAVAH